MTKSVRIENACLSNYQLNIITQEKVLVKDDDTGDYLWTGEWRTTNVRLLRNPTDLLTDYVTSTRRFVIEEKIND